MVDIDITAKKWAVHGHNLLITGQCGTGKSQMLRNMISDLRRLGKKVAVCSTTGISCMQLGSGSVTLHHWCGIGDGRYTFEFLSSNFMSDDMFHDARERIKKTEILVLDEIGMASKKIFEMVELVCRISKSLSRLFGGLQVIAAGDFKQLPPVPNYRYDDDGSYCFESQLFCEVFPHHINLKDVLRQKERDLIKAIHELCDGKPSSQTEAFLRSFERDLNVQDPSKVTRLFGTNFEVDYVNSLFLEENPGSQMIYVAVDTGERHHLLKSGAPRKLVLKVGAPVIATRNLPGMCNGMQGVVAAIPDTGPIISFSGKLFTITRVSFDCFDPKKSQVIASRSQYPVKLAYAMTIHRSQGMTIDALEIDCHSIFQPGQLGVAVGRVVSSENLKIVNFNKTSATLKHPDKVYEFYYKECVQPQDDLTCCIKDYRIGDSHEESDDDNDNDSDKDTGGMIGVKGDNKGDVDEETADSETSDVLICPYDCNQFLNENANLSFLPTTITENFIKAVQIQSNILFTKLNMLKCPSTSEEFSHFYGILHSYLTSEEHLSTLNKLKDSRKPQKLSAKVMFWIVHKVVSERQKDIIDQQIKQKASPQVEITPVILSKIRYLAGACIKKVSNMLKLDVTNKLYAKTENIRVKRHMSFVKHRLIGSLISSQEESKASSSVVESFKEIDHKQGPSQGLLHVTDTVFNFFLNLHKLVQKNLTASDFHIYLDKLHLHLRTLVFTDDVIFQEWTNLFKDCDDEILHDMFESVCEYFIRISLSEGLHSFKESIPKKKKQALRSKLQALSERANITPSTSQPMQSEESFNCSKCNALCVWEPTCVAEESIQCDTCDMWYHYKCQQLTGNEAFLKRKSSKWSCSDCLEKGTSKSRGKGRGKKRKL